MTLLRFLNVTTYRYYISQLLRPFFLVPIQGKSAISLTADFRNPKTTIEVDFETIQKVV